MVQNFDKNGKPIADLRKVTIRLSEHPALEAELQRLSNLMALKEAERK